MRSKLAYVLTLAAAAFYLSGCSYLRATGPCFGTGCPSRTVGQNGQYKLGQGPKPVATATAAPNSSQPGAPAANASATRSAPPSRAHRLPQQRNQLPSLPPPAASYPSFPSSAEGP